MKWTFKILCSALLVFSSSTFAHYYAGVQTGIYQATFNNVYHDLTDVIRQHIAEPASQYAYPIGIAFGYKTPFCGQYFWGVDLSANYVGHKAVFMSGASTTAFTDSLNVNYYIDLTFVPGLKLSNSVDAYLKLGLSYAAIQDRLSSPTGFGSIMENYNTNKGALGFAAALGVTKALTNCVTLYTEAGYHDYGSVNFQGFQNFTASYSHSAHVIAYDVLVGAAYNFGI